MSHYLPPSELPQVGRKLNFTREYSKLLAQLEDRDTVFALFDRGVYYTAPIIRNQEDFDQAHKLLVSRTQIRFIGFFAVQDYEDDADNPFVYPGRA